LMLKNKELQLNFFAILKLIVVVAIFLFFHFATRL